MNNIYVRSVLLGKRKSKSKYKIGESSKIQEVFLSMVDFEQFKD